jgi:flagellar hook-length control protein FliK
VRGDATPSIQTEQIAQSVLLPFLSALSEMDGRAAQRRETEASEQAAESGATSPGGLNSATAVLQADQKATEGSLAASTDALRRQSVAAEQRGEAQAGQDPRSDNGGRSAEGQSNAGGDKPAGRDVASARSPAPATKGEAPSREPPSSPPARTAGAPAANDAPTDKGAASSARLPDAAASRSIPPVPSPQAAAATPSITPSQALAVASAAVAKPGSTANARVEAAQPRSGPAAPQAAEPRSNAPRSADPGIDARRSGESTRAAASAKAAGASAEKGKNDANLTQILRAIQTRIHDKNARVQMRLDPPSLGAIRISMQLQDRDMTLRIDTETHLAQRLLSEEAEALRDALRASGIHLERIEVRTQPTADSTSLQQNETPDPQPREAEDRAGDGRPGTARGDGPANEAGAGESQWTEDVAPDWPPGWINGATAERSLNVLA